MRKSTSARANRATKEERLLSLLADGGWHSTKELRRIAHYFSALKWKLVHVNGYLIERRRHPVRRWQHQYRLVDELDA